MTVEEIQAELDKAVAAEQAAYWAFTRQARGKPVPPELTRRVCDLERQLREAKRKSVL